VGRTLNVGEARVIGLELGSRWQINSRYSLKANITLQDAQALQRFNAFNGKQLPGEAQQAAYFRLQRTTKDLRLYLEADGSWNRFYDQANVLAAKDRWIQNMGAEWTAGAWSLSGSINNIGNSNYEDFNGLPRPGRSFTVSLTTTIQ